MTATSIRTRTATVETGIEELDVLLPHGEAPVVEDDFDMDWVMVD